MKKTVLVLLTVVSYVVLLACSTGYNPSRQETGIPVSTEIKTGFGEATTEEETGGENLAHGESGYRIEDGIAQPILQYSNYPDRDYRNADSDILRFCVWVETDYDTDNDGLADLVKAFVQVPKAAAEGKYQAAVIYDPTPYNAGTIADDEMYRRLEEYSGKEFDYDILYKDCEKRSPDGEISTLNQAMTEDPGDWYYKVPGSGEQCYSYGKLYDYYLIRGFAVVEASGIGTYGSEGYSLCGFDLERDSHKCVVEWLTGDRTAYAAPNGTTAIKADWSNGKVAMTGVSYGGTLPFEVATTGVKGLETIIPFAGIASWYDYSNSQGVTRDTFGNYSDYLAGFTCGGLFMDDDWTVVNHDYAGWLWKIASDQNEANGNYTDIWTKSDYSGQYENIRCSALVVHGLNDFNVTTKQSDLMVQAFQKAGATVKLVLHQDGHFLLDGRMVNGKLWQEIVNGWLCHYLLGIDNGAEDMPAVTYQSNVDGQYYTCDSWRDFTYEAIAAKYNEERQTITSAGYDDYVDAYREQYGITKENLKFVDEIIKDEFYTRIPENNAAVYELELPEGSTIYGVPEIHFQASPTVAGYAGLQITAVLVDTLETEESFEAYMTYGSLYNIVSKRTYDSFDMGGGYGAGAITELVKSYTKAKAITYGWMDLANPGCGYDSREYHTDTSIQSDTAYNYTFYMQPTIYTLQPGHKLSLILTTYDAFTPLTEDPAMLHDEEYYTDYGFTVDNRTLDVELPLKK